MHEVKKFWTKPRLDLLKRVTAFAMAVLMLLSASMAVQIVQVHRAARAYRAELGLSEESAKWDAELVSLSKNIERGQYEAALTDMDAAMKKGADREGGMWLKRAAILVLLGRYDEALDDLDQADSRDGSLSDSAVIRAQIHVTQGNSTRARRELEKFLAAHPGNIACAAALAEIDYDAGDYLEALVWYRTALQDPQDPDYDPACYLNSAACEMLLGDYPAAIAECEAYRTHAKSTDQNGSSYYLQAICQMGLAEYEPALENLRTAADSGFRPVACKEQETLCRWHMGDRDAARTLGQELLQSPAEEGADAGIYETLGIDRLQSSRYDEALSYFLRARKIGNTRAEDYYIGVCYMTQERYGKAADYLSSALDAGADEQLCRYNRGVCYVNLGRYEDAYEDLRLAAANAADRELAAEARELRDQLEGYL